MKVCCNVFKENDLNTNPKGVVMGLSGNGHADLRPSKPGPRRDVKDVWIEYKMTRTELLRNILIENYLHLVRYNAERIHIKLPEEVELDDLMSAGIFGLIDAIKAFDLERGVKFETYCVPRIRGAILDELRAMDWVPRLVRSRAHKLDAASKQLEVELGRSPTNDEIAKRLKVSMKDFEAMARDASAVGLVSLSRKWFETDGHKDVSEIDTLTDSNSVNPAAVADKHNMLDFITKGLSRLERLIILLYYYEGKPMCKIGEMFDMSESRISQIHSSILSRLRAKDRVKELWTRDQAVT